MKRQVSWGVLAQLGALFALDSFAGSLITGDLLYYLSFAISYVLGKFPLLLDGTKSWRVLSRVMRSRVPTSLVATLGSQSLLHHWDFTFSQIADCH